MSEAAIEARGIVKTLGRPEVEITEFTDGEALNRGFANERAFWKATAALRTRSASSRWPASSRSSTEVDGLAPR